jgi:signal transduction histidine kinase
MVVRFEVTDDGPGIPADRREQIFEIFFTTKAGGTGLGLPIARRIVETLGGTLSLEEGEPGARFRVTIPWTQVI